MELVVVTASHAGPPALLEQQSSQPPEYTRTPPPPCKAHQMRVRAPRLQITERTRQRIARRRQRGYVENLGQDQPEC
jgi:hypothetical protein